MYVQIAFVVPSPRSSSSEASFHMGLDESTESHSISSSNRRGGGYLSSCDSRTLVIWLEDYDDMNYIPTDILAQEATTGEEPTQDPSVIFIHSLRNGLFRTRYHKYLLIRALSILVRAF